MTRTTRIVTFVGALMSAACANATAHSPAGATAPGAAIATADTAEIDALNRQLQTLLRSGDAKGIAQLYTEDAVIRSPGRVQAQGRDAIEAYYARFGEAGWKLRPTTIGGSADAPYQTGTSEIIREFGGVPSVVNYSLSYRRDRDGRLRIQLDYYHVADRDAAGDSLAIVAAGKAFSAAYMRNDTATIARLYADSAVLLPPDRNIVSRRRIQRYFTWGPKYRQTNHEMRTEKLMIDGTTATEIGTWFSAGITADGKTSEGTGPYLIVWHKEADNQWRVVYDMWHRPPPPVKNE